MAFLIEFSFYTYKIEMGGLRWTSVRLHNSNESHLNVLKFGMNVENIQQSMLNSLHFFDLMTL